MTNRRGFHTAAPLLLRMGWLPMPLPAGKKEKPPHGMTGSQPEAIALAGNPDAWRERIRPYLESDEHATSNTGVRLPDNMIAIDVDDYVDGDKEKRGWENLATFAESHGLDHPSRSLPPTVRITSRGAKSLSGQRFYRLPKGVDPEEVMPQLPGAATADVDILRPWHRYTLDGGSLHPSGGVYRVYDERVKKGKVLANGLGSITPDDIPELPIEWLQALIAAKPAALSGEGGVLDEDARNRAWEALQAWIDENNYDVDDLTHEGAMELITAGARQAVLSFGDASQNNSTVATACVRLLATFMEDLGAGEPIPLRAAIEVAKHLYVKGGSRTDRPGEFDRALGWAFPKASEKVSKNLTEAEAIKLAQSELNESFWGQTEVLRSCRDFARSRLVDPFSMLGCAIAGVASWLPPHLVLPGLVGGVAGLDFYVALASGSGGGKSSAMKAAKDWLNVHPHDATILATDEPYVTTVSTAQGLIQAYTMSQVKAKSEQRIPGEVEHIQVRRSVRFEVDEIGALGAAMNAEGSMLKEFIKTMWTGTGAGTNAAEATRIRKLNDHEFRITIVAGVQPATADVILSGHGDGFPQRWLWVEAHDEDPPSIEEWREMRENPPPPLDWHVPVACHPLPLPSNDDDDEYTKIARAAAQMTQHVKDRFQVLEITESFEMKVYQAAVGGRRKIGDDATMTDVLDGHRILLQEKLAALLAALHGHIGITDQYEQMAEYLVARSDATRLAILAERQAASMREAEAHAVRQGRSAAITDVAKAKTQVEMTVSDIISSLSVAPDQEMDIDDAADLIPDSVAPDYASKVALLETIDGAELDGQTIRLKM